jgi:hypothetical protein
MPRRRTQPSYSPHRRAASGLCDRLMSYKQRGALCGCPQSEKWGLMAAFADSARGVQWQARRAERAWHLSPLLKLNLPPRLKDSWHSSSSAISVRGAASASRSGPGRESAATATAVSRISLRFACRIRVAYSSSFSRRQRRPSKGRIFCGKLSNPLAVAAQNEDHSDPPVLVPLTSTQFGGAGARKAACRDSAK